MNRVTNLLDLAIEYTAAKEAGVLMDGAFDTGRTVDDIATEYGDALKTFVMSGSEVVSPYLPGMDSDGVTEFADLIRARAEEIAETSSAAGIAAALDVIESAVKRIRALL